MNVLVVDDDPRVLGSTCRLLRGAGMTAEAAEHAEQATESLARHPRAHFDLVLLDVRMPGRSGWDLLTEMRERGDQTPVIFVTGVASAEERAHGLRLGADDYLAKPYSREELLARIEAVSRRRLALPLLRSGGLAIDTGRRTVELFDEAISLSPHEFDLLLALVLAGGHVVSRERLLADVWGLDFDPGTTVLEVTVGRLRRRLGDRGSAFVENVKSRGYRLATPGAAGVSGAPQG